MQATVKKVPAPVINTEAPKPTTVVQGKLVQVTGTKTGAISTAQQQAKKARLKDAEAPGQVGKYKGTQAIRVLQGAVNPHRGGYRKAAYDAMLKCKTAGEYALTGYKTKYLARWVAQGLIRIS